MRDSTRGQGLKFLLLEPFSVDSHRDFAEGLAEASSYEIKIQELPARFWKWRMQGAALEFYRKISNLREYDGIMATNMMSLTDFRALAGRHCPPVFLYFHENQLTYPLQKDRSPDYTYAFTDIKSALAAEKVAFNSASHRLAFLEKLPAFIKMMPDFRPYWAEKIIREKSEVCMPGCRFETGINSPPPSPAETPLVIWNHRWEHDKNPEAFFRALYRAADRGVDFRAAVMGRQFSKHPAEFDRARRILGDRIVQFGTLESKKDYIKWLRQGTVAVSTAVQENFGMATVEAARYGCLPLVPHRLSYPEIIPGQFHDTLLYRSEEELAGKLEDILLDPAKYETVRRGICLAMAEFSWENRIRRFDREIETLSRLHPLRAGL